MNLPMTRRDCLARACACVLACIAGMPLAAAAQATERVAPSESSTLGDLSIEQLMDLSIAKVYSASKYEQKVTQAPASISIVTADEIRKLGYRTLADVLRGMRGLYISDDRNYSYVGSRGFLRPGDYNTRVLLLVDGHRINENVYDAFYVGHDAPVDVDLIERVEFIRGPSSSIYGSSAFFGVLNVITRRAEHVAGAELSAEAGSFGTYKGRVSYGRQFANAVDLTLSASAYRSDGQRQLYFPEFDQRISSEPRAASDGIARDADEETAFNLYGRLKYREFTLAAAASSRRKSIPTASFRTEFDDGREQSVDDRAYLDLRYEHHFGSQVDLLARAFYDRYSYYGDYPYNYASPGGSPDLVLFRDQAKGEWLGTEWQATARLFDRHTFVTGVEYRENLQASQESFDQTDPPAYYLDQDERSRVVGVFAQGDVALLSKLHLNAGVRYDYYAQGFGGTLNPRLGMIYHPGRSSTIKLLYGQAFRAPNPYERFYYYERQAMQPELRPERIRTFELVFEQYFDEHHRLNLSAYHYAIKELIAQTATPDAHLYFVNLDRAEANGVEAEFEAKYDGGWQLHASYALQRAVDAGTRRELTSSPRHLAKAHLIAPLCCRVTAGLQLQYQGATQTLGGMRAGNFLVVNLNILATNVVPGFDVSATAYNLFDRDYGYPGAEDHLQDVIEQDGRSFRLKLGYRF